jgi:hypothetical protein
LVAITSLATSPLTECGRLQRRPLRSSVRAGDASNMLREFDIVIVGAVSSGAVVAARASEDPNRSVLLLEAGPDYGL